MITGPTIELIRGDTLSQAITGLGVLTGYVSLDFTVKREPLTDLDADAIINIRKNASGLTDGLLILNGATGTAAQGSITIDDATTGAITIALAAAATDDLDPDAGLFYDVQMITALVITTLARGVVNIDADVTRAVA